LGYLVVQCLTKFARLMRVIMDNSSKPLIPIKDELQALELYLELESVRCTGKFSYTVNISSEIDIDYDQIPSMLIQPYVENAIWHGLMLREEGGHLLISLSIEGSLIKCIIEDNGIGRRRSAELKKSNHKSLGMSITKERLEILNSLHGSQLSVEIVDLVNDAGEAAGTRVVIYIPA
jgi:LytS/YehU family sensor histidine kinase